MFTRNSSRLTFCSHGNDEPRRSLTYLSGFLLSTHEESTGVSQMSCHAINATTPLPSKIRAVQFFNRTGKQCDLLFGVHIYERLLRRVKIVQSGVDAAWDGFYQAVNRPRQPHSQVLSPTRLSLSLATLRRVGENPGDEAADLCRLALTRGSTIIKVSFPFLYPLGYISLLLLEYTIVKLWTKRVKLNLPFKLSCLNSNLALTLVNFNPAMNNGYETGPRAGFSKVPVTFRARKSVFCLPCLHSGSKFQ